MKACKAHLNSGVADVFEKGMGQALVNRNTAFGVEDKHALQQVQGLSWAPKTQRALATQRFTSTQRTKESFTTVA